MQKTLLLLFTLSLFNSLSAQEVSVTPNPSIAEEEGLNLEDPFVEVYNDALIKNEGTEETEYAWIRTVESAPSEWEFAIVDDNQSYFTIVDTVPLPVILTAGEEGFLRVSALPRGIAGCATVRMDIALWSDTGNHEVIYSAYYEFKVNNSSECLSSQEDTPIENVSIYPNPTTHSFQITNLESIPKVNKIDVFNIVGEQVKSFHPTASEYNIGDLPDGLYMVSIISAEKGILKTSRVIKTSTY